MAFDLETSLAVASPRDEFLKLSKAPLLRDCNMAPEMRHEMIDICIYNLEKYSSDLERCSQAIKETADKKYGGGWNVVVGKAFAYQVTHAFHEMMLLYVGSASLGLLVWRS